MHCVIIPQGLKIAWFSVDMVERPKVCKDSLMCACMLHMFCMIMWCLFILQNEKLCSNFDDIVSIGPCVPADTDAVTLYDEYFPGGPTYCHTPSLGSIVGESPLATTHVTYEDIFEHLSGFKSSDYDQGDSGIGVYSGGQISYDCGSGFSGQSISSYVHCGQYNCTCNACLASRTEGKSPTTEGKSPTTEGKSPVPPETDNVYNIVGTSSTSLPELRSCDYHVMTISLSPSISSEIA